MARQARPQDVLAPPARAAIFLVLTARPGAEDAVQALLGDVAGLRRAVGFRSPEDGLSCVVGVQKYLHDLAAWGASPVEDQERVIGRTKLSDVEFPDAVKPSNSHAAMNTIVDTHGAQQKIVRDNMQFGTIGPGEFGVHLIAYAATPDVIEQMLHNMFVGNPPGNHDRVLDFSSAVTGGLFFVPHRRLPRRPDSPPDRRCQRRDRGSLAHRRLAGGRQPEGRETS